MPDMNDDEYFYDYDNGDATSIEDEWQVLNPDKSKEDVKWVSDTEPDPLNDVEWPTEASSNNESVRWDDNTIRKSLANFKRHLHKAFEDRLKKPVKRRSVLGRFFKPKTQEPVWTEATFSQTLDHYDEQVSSIVDDMWQLTQLFQDSEFFNRYIQLRGIRDVNTFISKMNQANPIDVVIKLRRELKSRATKIGDMSQLPNFYKLPEYLRLFWPNQRALLKAFPEFKIQKKAR